MGKCGNLCNTYTWYDRKALQRMQGVARQPLRLPAAHTPGRTLQPACATAQTLAAPTQNLTVREQTVAVPVPAGK